MICKKVKNILCPEFGMMNASALLMSCLLTSHQGFIRLITSHENLILFLAHPVGFFKCFLTQSECWVNYFDEATMLLTCSKEGQRCFTLRLLGIEKRHYAYQLTSKRSYHPWRILSQLTNVVTKGHDDQTSRKTGKKGLVSSGQGSGTQKSLVSKVVACGRF